MTRPEQHNLEEIIVEISSLGAADALRQLTALFPGQSVFSTSFSLEDQVITDLLVREEIGAEIFTLDTGRLFPETYSTWSQTVERYQKKIIAYYPEAQSLQDWIQDKGPNSFYESVENRKACCHLRKVEPLQRAIRGKALWITGIRAEHSPNRQDMQPLEWDDANQLLKFHPLLNWSAAQVKDYIDEFELPYNPLHDKGFVSIGCAPCTRAIGPGEDFRAGRWWWEDSSKKECGLHVHAEAAKG